MCESRLKNKNMIKAEIVADSINENDNRITTFVVEFPRIVLAELNTHRAMCLDGDTELWFDLPSKQSKGEKKLFKMKISDFYDKWDSCDSIDRTNLRQVDEKTGKLTHTTVSDCFFNGEVDMYEISLENGYRLTCSADHQLFSEDGWFTLNEYEINHTEYAVSYNTPLPKLSTSDSENASYQKFVAIKSIKFVGKRKAYDLEVSSDYHNFVADGVVVHNSRNSASSRAIPFKTMLERVTNNPFIPIRFQKDHKGMQGVEYFEGEEHDLCVKDWLSARDRAIESAKAFNQPVTKQLRNRLLEPFMWHRVIITATDFENFFGLRAHEAAEIHIQQLAYQMLEAYNKSEPKSLKTGEWHIPFGDQFDKDRLLEVCEKFEMDSIQDAQIAIATARCARISYNTFEGKDDYIKDIELHDRLLKGVPRHCSPAEHCAVADSDKYFGPFRGWKQYRKFFNDENMSDKRVVRKTFKK